MKKRRGAGNRGGRGNAGTGKKGDVKKPSIWKPSKIKKFLGHKKSRSDFLVNKKYFGKRGFKRKGSRNIKCVNVGYLDENCDNLSLNKKIKKEDNVYIIDLKDIGFNKLLSKGKLTKKFKIKVEFASKKVIDAVKKSGGEVILADKK